jgi:hypothetical protein
MRPMSRPSVPARPSQPAGPTDARGERRPSPRTTVPPPPDSTQDFGQEDFLFHLYRGSELLQENRVLEAKEELEFALTMQPLDAKGQDLLGFVYFRLGLYPRAIQIYEGLQTQFSRDLSIKINLALAYLKTGQAEPARRVLQDAVRLNPEHKRAWGYLGLALQRLGELEQAHIAFERGGHPMMAQRVTEQRRRSIPAPSIPSLGVEPGVRDVAETAFSEVDAGELRFALAEPELPKQGDGQWHAVEPGETSARSPYTRTLPPPSLQEIDPAHQLATVSPPTAALVALAAPPISVPLPTPDRAVAAQPLLSLPEGRTIGLHASGIVIVRTGDGPARAFAGRLDALRAVAGTALTQLLHRRARDADTTEMLGGVGSPFVRVEGDVQLALGARHGRAVALFEIEDDLAFIREDMLLGFELRVGYENGRVAFDSPGEGGRQVAEGVAVVQLRGSGAIVLEVDTEIASIPCTPERPLMVRREWIVGWLGRLVTRALPPKESPSGQRGLVSFSGDGTVFVQAG